MSAPARLDRIAELLQENELLRAEIAELKAVALPPLEETIAVRLLEKGIRLTPAERTIVALLTQRAVASRSALMFALYQQQDKEAEEKILDVYICRLRQKLKPVRVGIETVPSYGFRLTPEGRETLLGVEPKAAPIVEPQPRAEEPAEPNYLWGDAWRRG